MANLIFGTTSANGTVFSTDIFASSRSTTDINDIIYAGAGNDVFGGLLGNDVLFGEADNDKISGGAGDDLMDGGTGNDSMYGGVGNDIYIVNSASDVVDETSDADGSGTTDAGGVDTVVVIDTVVSDLDYSLPSSTFTLGKLENLVLGEGTTVTTANGNELANRLFGTSANETLVGNAGDDYLDGRGGSDSLVGGIGNDTYLTYGTGTTTEINEGLNAGNDTVLVALAATGSYTVLANIERVTVVDTYSSGTTTLVTPVTITAATLTTAVTLTGNGAANTLTGSSTVGSALSGGAGLDVLTGGAGNDTLDGGTNNLVAGDSMSGGAGNDIYFVDSSFDVITEVTSATDLGDIINVTMSSGIYTLPATAGSVTGAEGIDVIRIISTGSVSINASAAAKISLLGNSAVNALTGGSGNDTLDGGAGGDALTGGNGNDTYVVDSLSDSITDSGGTDTLNVAITAAGTTYNMLTLASTVDNATVTSAAAINVTGNTLPNTLIGNSAVNTLTSGGAATTFKGGFGNDVLVGGTGIDTFVFNTTPNSTTNMDTITSFKTAGADMIDLDHTIFAKFLTVGALDTTSFVRSAGAVALDSNDYVIYDSTSSVLYYDSDGSGTGVKVAIARVVGLTASTDIVII